MIMRSQATILGGGGIIQHNSSYYNLFYFLGLATLSTLLAKPLFIFRVGITPIRPVFARALIRFIFSRAVTPSVRDQPSLERLRHEIGYGGQVSILPDPAFDRSYEAAGVRESISKLAMVPFNLFALRPPLNTNPRQSAARKYGPEQLAAATEDLAPGLDALINDIIEVTGTTKCVFVSSQVPRDANLAEHLSRILKTQNIEIISQPCTFDELQFLCENAQCVVSSRFHACIAAIKANAPLVAIDNFKITALVQERASSDRAFSLTLANYESDCPARTKLRAFLTYVQAH
jgi:polysaccharide pyruvyl transferase WcaK-like protein